MRGGVWGGEYKEKKKGKKKKIQMVFHKIWAKKRGRKKVQKEKDESPL